MPRRSGHRDWANAHHRAQMERKRPGSGRSKGDRVILLLSTIFVVSMGLTVFLWPSASTSSPETGSPGFACQVSSVTDGDTLRCADGTRVRLHAIAARERDETCSPGHPCPTASGASATAKLAELAGGQTLACRSTGTSYDRVTAICNTASGVEINCAMVRSGTAVVWERFNRTTPICR